MMLVEEEQKGGSKDFGGVVEATDAAGAVGGARSCARRSKTR